MPDETTVNFDSHGDTCVADLHLPSTQDPPVVVMAHGFGATRSMRLPAYAQRFKEEGLAVFLFDYRGFGDSEGSPRHLIDPQRHVEDWVAAIDAARGLDELDGSRLGLWGTSFSGGHVLEAAARRPVAAIVAQVPFLSGPATTWHLTHQLGPTYPIAATMKGLRDAAGALFDREPFTVPIVEDPGTFALLNTKGAKEGYLSIIPDGADWENRAPARIALELPFYRPLSEARNVDAPLHVTVATADRLVPPSAARTLAGRVDDATLRTEPVGHFDVYHGELFEGIVDEQAAFLVDHLGP